MMNDRVKQIERDKNTSSIGAARVHEAAICCNLDIEAGPF